MNQGNAPLALLELRAKYWCSQVVNKLGFDDAQSLDRATKKAVGELGQLTGIEFRKYEKGTRPLKQTLDLVDKVVANSSEWYLTGPDSFVEKTEFDIQAERGFKNPNSSPIDTRKIIPLWPVLGGDKEQCRKWVNHVLRTQFPEVFTEDQIRLRGWETKTFQLIELVTPSSEYRAGHIARIPLVNMATTAMEFFRMQATELYKAQENTIQRDTFLGFVKKIAPLMEMRNHLVIEAYESLNSDSFDSRLVFTESTLLAFFALYHIGIQTENENILVLVNYVLAGLLESAIENEFVDLGFSVKNYVQEQMNIVSIDFS